MRDRTRRHSAEFRIEPAERDRLPLIHDLAVRIWNQHYPGIITQAQIDYMLGRDYAPERLQRDLDEGTRFDLLFESEQAIGFCAFGPAGEPGAIKLHKLYLEANRRGQGLGSLMLDHVERETSRLGYERICLQVNRGNQDAIRAYLANGYYVREDVVVDIGGGFVMDDHLMVKELT